MLDLKYLTIADLELFAENLKLSIEDKKRRSNYLNVGVLHESDHLLHRIIKDEEAELLQVEAEILERTLLQRPNPGGATT